METIIEEKIESKVDLKKYDWAEDPETSHETLTESTDPENDHLLIIEAERTLVINDSNFEYVIEEIPIPVVKPILKKDVSSVGVQTNDVKVDEKKDAKLETHSTEAENATETGLVTNCEKPKEEASKDTVEIAKTEVITIE